MLSRLLITSMVSAFRVQCPHILVLLLLEREVFGKTISVEYASYYVPAPGAPPFQIRGRGPPQKGYDYGPPHMGGPPRGGRGGGRDSGPGGPG